MSGFGNQGPFEKVSAIDNVDYDVNNPNGVPFVGKILKGIFTSKKETDPKKKKDKK